MVVQADAVPLMASVRPFRFLEALLPYLEEHTLLVADISLGAHV